MKIFLHNYNENSLSGPNKFTTQLFNTIVKKYNTAIVNNQNLADAEFCLIQQQALKIKPMVLRLDGIWFNSEQDYTAQNEPIRYAYNNADAVVFQSEFNKKLTEHWFGKHRKSCVIHNRADVNLMNSLGKVNTFDEVLKNVFGTSKVDVWSCASTWRPHKRLRDNIRYFVENSPDVCAFLVAGKGVTQEEIDYAYNITKFEKAKRVIFLGEINYKELVSLYMRSSTFVHLAYLDHCPNVVVDAQAMKCRIICSSSGGTKEVVSDGIVIEEASWDFSPIKLYKPPNIDFGRSYKTVKNNSKTIEDCAIAYYNTIKEVMSEGKRV